MKSFLLTHAMLSELAGIAHFFLVITFSSDQMCRDGLRGLFFCLKLKWDSVVWSLMGKWRVKYPFTQATWEWEKSVFISHIYDLGGKLH